MPNWDKRGSIWDNPRCTQAILCAGAAFFAQSVVKKQQVTTTKNGDLASTVKQATACALSYHKRCLVLIYPA